MKKWLRFLAGGMVLLATIAMCAPGCSKKDGDGKGAEKKGSGDKGDGNGGAATVHVAFVSNNPEVFWTIAEAGTAKAAKEFNAEVSFRRPQKGTAADQKAIVDDLITLGVQAIAISVIDPVNQQSYLNEVAAKMPLITQDNDAPKTDRLCYLGTDNYLAGREVGKQVKKALPDGGTITIFVGRGDSLNAQERRQGVLDELAGQKDAKGEGKKYGKYRLHDTLYDFAVRATAKRNADDAITALQQEERLCFVGLWAYNPPTIYSAVKDAGKLGKIKIVGFDEDEETLLGIEKGHIEATVVQDPFNFGYQSVKLMAEIVRGDRSGIPKDGLRYVPHRLITQKGRGGEDVIEFRKQLHQLMGK